LLAAKELAFLFCRNLTKRFMIGNTYSALSFGPVLCVDVVLRKNSDL